MRYIIFVIDGPGNLAAADEMAKIDAFNEKLQNNGHWITAGGINGASKSLVIDNRDNKGEITEGSLVTGPDNYSGFWLIEADSDEIAKELAVEGSFCCNRKVELRPYLR